MTVEQTKEQVRHISELKNAKNGDYWMYASSDPGDDGPFSSAIYSIGKFKFDNNQLSFTRIVNSSPVFRFNTRNVEGSEWVENEIIVATYDEHFGGDIKTVYFK